MSNSFWITTHEPNDVGISKNYYPVMASSEHPTSA